MKKIINAPEHFVDECLEGILLAYGDRLCGLNGDNRIIMRKTPAKKGKVGLVTAGGSGHLPVFLGYVGEGMLDGCTVGNVFASPASGKMLDMIRAADSGSGVLAIYGNYGGDVMNLALARENADFEDIKTDAVLITDDVASRPREEASQRRGVAGMVYVFKAAGAAAEEMLPLEEVAAVAREAAANIRTMGVALSPCILPEVGRPSFQINEDEIEIGMGIHGEPGIEVRKMMTADEIAEEILGRLLADMPLEPGSEVSVMVNGLGATPPEELLIVYRRIALLLRERGVEIYMPHIGEFATSMEMAGCSVTIFKLTERLKKYLRAPASTPFYTNHNK